MTAGVEYIKHKLDSKITLSLGSAMAWYMARGKTRARARELAERYVHLKNRKT